VFRTLPGSIAELRALRRDARGRLGEGALVAAASLLCAAGREVAIVEPKKPRSRGTTARSAWGV